MNDFLILNSHGHKIAVRKKLVRYAKVDQDKLILRDDCNYKFYREIQADNDIPLEKLKGILSTQEDPMIILSTGTEQFLMRANDISHIWPEDGASCVYFNSKAKFGEFGLAFQVEETIDEILEKIKEEKGEH